MPGPTFLADDRVALRTIEEDDIGFLCAGDNDPSIRRLAGGDVFPVSREDERAALRELESRAGVALLVTVEGDEGPVRVGYIELDPIDPVAGVAEVGFWIVPEHRRRGIASASLDLLAAYAFGELRLHRLEAEVYDANEGSVAFFRELGFVEEGARREAAFVDGTHVDVRGFGLLAREWREAR